MERFSPAQAANPRRPFRAFVAVLVLLTGATVQSAARADDAYPTRPVHIIVGYGPGGIADVVMRVVAQKLGERMGQQFLVDNKPGAGGVVAANEVAKATPDGYTLYMAGNGATISQNMFKTRPFDMRDVQPVSALTFYEIVLATKEGSPLKSIQDVVAAARARPGRLNFGAIAVGSTQNLTAELFKSAAGIDATVVAFRTTPEVVGALLRGDIDVAFEYYVGVKSPVDNHEARIVATTGAERSAVLPSVPTVAEGGLPGFEVTGWNALFAPKRTPAAIVATLNKQINEIMALPDVKAKLLALGMDARGSTPEALEARVKSDIDKWATIIEKSGIQKQ